MKKNFWLISLIVITAIFSSCSLRPVIVDQPESLNVNLGEEVEFKITALRANKFEWLRDGVVLEGFIDPVLTLSEVKESDEGAYQVRAKNLLGYADSEIAYLTVNDPPIIITNPVSIEINPGENSVMTIIADGTQPISYQWYLNGQRLIGATNPELVIENAQLFHVGSYYCSVNNVTNQEIFSAEATLRLIGYPDKGIVFTRIPEYGSFDNLYGLVYGVNLSQFKVAVYAISQWGYWIKPYVHSPNTYISLTPYDEYGSNWNCDVTTGTDDQYALGYVAFLIPRDSMPILCTGNSGGWGGVPCPDIPEVPDAVCEPAITYRLEKRVIEAFGYLWEVKFSRRPVNPGYRNYSDREEDVFVDENGFVNLVSSYFDNKWHGAEIRSEESFGYGTYIFQVQGMTELMDVNRVLGLFLYELLSEHPAHREIDILEIALWGDPDNPTNAQYVVQPCSICPGCDSCHRLVIDELSDFTTYLVWEPGWVEMRTYIGNHIDGIPPEQDLIAQWEYEGTKVPEPNDVRVHVNLWILTGKNPANGIEQKVVITGFDHVLIPPWLAGTAPSVTISTTATQVMIGASVTLTASVTGSEPISYRWKKDGIEIEGLNEPSMIISPATLGDTGNYTCQVTNEWGQDESDPIYLEVFPPDPIVTLNPTSQTVNPGATVTFQVIATGGLEPLGYQWFKIIGDTAQEITGATEQALTLIDVCKSDEAGYWCRVTNATGPIKITRQ